MDTFKKRPWWFIIYRFRDQFGITQIVVDKNNKVFSLLEHLRVESVVKVSGEVVSRNKDTKK